MQKATPGIEPGTFQLLEWCNFATWDDVKVKVETLKFKEIFLKLF